MLQQLDPGEHLPGMAGEEGKQVEFLGREVDRAAVEGDVAAGLVDPKEAGLTLPMIWPPFADVPVSKTLDDLKRLKEEILPEVEAA